MKKPTKRDTVNLFFSAFLIVAFIVFAPFPSEREGRGETAFAQISPRGHTLPV